MSPFLSRLEMTQALNVVVDCLRERSVLFRIITDDHDGILSELRARGVLVESLDIVR